MDSVELKVELAPYAIDAILKRKWPCRSRILGSSEKSSVITKSFESYSDLVSFSLK